MEEIEFFKIKFLKINFVKIHFRFMVSQSTIREMKLAYQCKIQKQKQKKNK